MMPFNNKGTDLELRTAAYFQSHGFFVRRGVMLSVAAGTADATDIDLYAIRFNIPLSEERLIADCKDRKRSKPFERVLWTLGLATFAKATHSVVVLPKSIWQVRDFATQGNIQVLEALEVDRHLRSVSSTFEPFSDADPFIEHRKGRITDRDLYRDSLKLRQMLVGGHPLTNLNRIIRMLSHLGKSLSNGGEREQELRRYVCFDAAVIAAVMLVRFAAEVKWTPEKDWTDYARKKLTFGDVPPHKARELAQLALDRAIPEGIPAPHYTTEVIRLLDSLLANPTVTARLPYFLDYHLFGYLLRDSIHNHRSPVVLDTRAESAIRLSKRVLSALSYAAGTPNTLWEVVHSGRQEKSSSTTQAGEKAQDASPTTRDETTKEVRTAAEIQLSQQQESSRAVPEGETLSEKEDSQRKSEPENIVVAPPT